MKRLRELILDLREVPLSRTQAWRELGEKYGPTERFEDRSEGRSVALQENN